MIERRDVEVWEDSWSGSSAFGMTDRNRKLGQSRNDVGKEGSLFTDLLRILCLSFGFFLKFFENVFPDRFVILSW